MAFSNLSDAEFERLALLLEELGEVQQAIGKVLRHGYACHHPDDSEKLFYHVNRENLERELGDVMFAISLMTQNKDVNAISINHARLNKSKSAKPYLHHQG